MYKIAIFASGSGTNAENIIKTFHGGNLLRVVKVYTDVPDAGVIERLRPYGVETEYVEPRVWRQDPGLVVDALRAEGVDLVVLAGFMRLVDKRIVEAFPRRILNLHPALLPAYGGKGMYGHHVHEAVIAAGEKKSGVTVHYIDEHYDRGEILMQAEVEIEEGETPQTLEAKIHEAEYAIYPRAIAEALRRMPPSVPRKTGVPPALPHIDNGVSEHQQAAPADAPETPKTGSVPPPVPEVESVWAQELKMDYDPEEVARRAQQQIQNGAPSGHGTPAGNGATPPPNPAGPVNLQGPEQSEPVPPNYFVLSIVMTLLCCTPAGIVAIVFSSMVNSRYYSGNVEGAKRASRNAEIWIIVSFCLGVLSTTLYLPFSMLFG